MARIERMTRKRLGELLREEGLITPEQLSTALQLQQDSHKAVGDLLVEMGVVSETDIARIICLQFGVPYLDPALYDIPDEVKAIFPLHLLHHHQVVPLDCLGNTLLIATAGLINAELIDELEFVSGKQLHLCITTGSQVEAVLETEFSNIISEEDAANMTELGNLLLSDGLDQGEAD